MRQEGEARWVRPLMKRPCTKNSGSQTISTTMSKVLSGWMMTFAEINSSTLSAETRKINWRYFPRKVYALAGPESQLDCNCDSRSKEHYHQSATRSLAIADSKRKLTTIYVAKRMGWFTISLASAQKPSCGSSLGFRGILTSASWWSVTPLRISWMRTVTMRKGLRGWPRREMNVRNTTTNTPNMT